MEKHMTAVEWLAEKYNYITWLRNRDEISPETADNMREKYLEHAKAMEKEQIIKAWNDHKYNKWGSENTIVDGNHYYKETYQKPI